MTHKVVAAVTARIVERSRATREAYLAQIDAAQASQPGRGKLSCANWAHAFAAQPAGDKLKMLDPNAPNLGIVTAYNDMLSAHQPYERYPELIRTAARQAGATAQVAGGTPAMCDGVTQGRPGMELSLFSRDLIAMAVAVALSHDAFDAALYLGICDKIVPGLVIGGARLRTPARRVRAVRPDGERPVERREGQDPRPLCRGQGRAGRAPGLGAEELPRPRHLHLLRHRQLQPDADGDHGPAPAGRRLRRARQRPARRPDHGRRAPRHRRHRQGERLHPDRPGGGREGGGQRRTGPPGHRRLDQPHPSPRRDGGGGGDRPAVGGLRRTVRRHAPLGPRLPQRRRRREPLPGVGRHAGGDPRAPGRGPRARGRDHRLRRGPFSLHPRPAAAPPTAA